MTHAIARTTVFFLLLTQAAWAEAVRLVDAPRIRLGDVVSVPDSVASEDMGPSPPPGGSRLLSFRDLNRILKDHGLPESLTESVRVVRAVSERNNDELRRWFEPEVLRVLPASATLVKLDPPSRLRVAPSATVMSVRLGQLPKREGLIQTSAIVELSSGGTSPQRVSVSLTLRLDASASKIAVPMGAPLTLSISTEYTHVTALGVATTAGDIGDVVPCRVLRSNRILMARITSPTAAEVLAR
jgi:hypothetical protein